MDLSTKHRRADPARPHEQRLRFITSVVEHDGTLYLGSAEAHGIGVLPALHHGPTLARG
jgi:hypothetical protein